jgi:ribokinase
MPKVGETLMGKKFQMGFGGKGANKAIACSRLGSNCAVISRVIYPFYFDVCFTL